MNDNDPDENAASKSNETEKRPRPLSDDELFSVTNAAQGQSCEQPDVIIGETHQVRKRLKAEAKEGQKFRDVRRVKPPRYNAKPWEPSLNDFRLYDAYLKGQASGRLVRGQAQLAEEEGVTRQLINQVVAKVERWLAVKYIADIRGMRVRATARLELLYATALESYVHSCEDAVTITKTALPNGKVVEKEERRGQAGSPACLAEARKCIEQMLDIWGAKAPKEANLNVTAALRVSGRSPEEAIKARMDYLQNLLKPSDS